MSVSSVEKSMSYAQQPSPFKPVLTGIYTTIKLMRLESKIIGPYNTAKPLHIASLNLHATLVILRGATRYLHLSRRLALQIAETNPQKTSIDPHALLRAANTVSELSKSPHIVLTKPPNSSRHQNYQLYISPKLM